MIMTMTSLCTSYDAGKRDMLFVFGLDCFIFWPSTQLNKIGKATLNIAKS